MSRTNKLPRSGPILKKLGQLQVCSWFWCSRGSFIKSSSMLVLDIGQDILISSLREHDVTPLVFRDFDKILYLFSLICSGVTFRDNPRDFWWFFVLPIKFSGQHFFSPSNHSTVYALWFSNDENKITVYTELLCGFYRICNILDLSTSDKL